MQTEVYIISSIRFFPIFFPISIEISRFHFLFDHQKIMRSILSLKSDILLLYTVNSVISNAMKLASKYSLQNSIFLQPITPNWWSWAVITEKPSAKPKSSIWAEPIRHVHMWPISLSNRVQSGHSLTTRLWFVGVPMSILNILGVVIRIRWDDVCHMDCVFALRKFCFYS